MTDDNDNPIDLSRRTVLQGTGGLGTLGLLTGPAAGRGNPGGRPPSSPPPGGNGGGGGSPVATVTLITGQTVHVTGDGERRRYTLPQEDAGKFRILDSDEGTYVIPDGVDLDHYSPLLFNVDFLIEQGVTDEETDTIPVVASMNADLDSDSRDVSMSAGDISSATTLSSIDAVALEVSKDHDGATARSGPSAQDALESRAVKRVYLDTKYEALLDTSADVVNAPAAREEFGVDGSGKSIAVLDTGIDTDHPDFGDRVVHQQDFSGDGHQDANGHGTHCAGIAAGAGTENGDYVGMAPGADLMAIKVLGDDGSGALSDIVAGIEHAVDQGADVISMSLGGPTQQDGPMEQAVNEAVDAGVVAAVAAGNDGGYQSLGSPGIAENAITVGASDGADGIPWFSSGGPSPYEYLVKPEVIAPGSAITATGSEDAGEYPYTDKSGTSMSTPHVAGVAALLLEDNSDWSPADVRDALVSTASPVDGEDVYKQGSGVIDAQAALDADLRVRDAVGNIGLVESAGTETVTVTLDNTGSEAVTVDASAALENVQDGDDLSDSVTVSPSSVTVDAGASEQVDVTVETGDIFGFNSGTLTLDTGSTTHRAVFGFVRGLEVTVDKIPHEHSDGVANDDLYAYAKDGSFSHLGFAAFDATGQASFVIFDDGGDYMLWSPGELSTGGHADEPTWTVGNVDISLENNEFTLDESATVPRPLDTSQVSEHEPLLMREFGSNLYANIEDGPTISAERSIIGLNGHEIRDTHVTPLTEEEPTNIGNSYLMFSETPDAEYVLDSPVCYHLFYGALSVSGPTDAVEVDPSELATENIEYHRTYEDQLLATGPGMYPADYENFPTAVLISFVADISDDRVHQTWYRNEQAVYDESWYDDGGFSGDYQLRRSERFIPENGATYDQPFNAEPFGNGVPTWELDDGTLSIHGQWYTDNSDHPFVAFQYAFNGPFNEFEITVDDEVVESGSNYYWQFNEYGNPIREIPDIPTGSSVGVSLDGGVLAVTERDTTTTTDYQVAAYEPGTPNSPPEVAAIDVTGLSTFNRVSAGANLAFVEIDTEADGVDDFAFYYAAKGSVSGTPFEGASGWHEADVVYGEGDTYGVLLDTSGYSGKLEVAAAATDSAGNSVETATFDALRIADGAETTVPADVKPDHFDLGSNQNVPVMLTSTGDVNVRDIDTDTLRLGDPEAVAEGGGAAPRRAHRVGRDRLMAHFRVTDTGYGCTDGPVAAQLTGQLSDGTTISGVDVVASVTCDDGN